MSACMKMHLKSKFIVRVPKTRPGTMENSMISIVLLITIKSKKHVPD